MVDEEGRGLEQLLDFSVPYLTLGVLRLMLTPEEISRLNPAKVGWLFPCLPGYPPGCGLVSR
jgi:hypothetical protein